MNRAHGSRGGGELDRTSVPPNRACHHPSSPTQRANTALVEIMTRLSWIGAALLAATSAAASEERSYPNEIVYLPGHTVTEKVCTPKNAAAVVVFAAAACC